MHFLLACGQMDDLDDASDVYGADSDFVQSVFKKSTISTKVVVDGGVVEGVVDGASEVVNDSVLGCVLKEEAKNSVAGEICNDGVKKGVKRRLFDSVLAVDHVHSKVHLKVGGGMA